MAIYKVQGPNGEVITIEGPDGANPNDVIAQAQTLYKPKEKTAGDYAKDFGKATASLADTALNAVTGTLDYAAYPLARAFGRTPEQATQETTSPKDVIGRALGITQDPAYQQELSRRMMGGIGQGVEQYAVKPIASATGLPEQDVSSMVNSAMLGAGVKAQPYINRAGQAVAQGMYAAEPYVKSAITTPTKGVFYDFPKGVIEGLVNKEYNPATSAMVPLRETYTPPAAAQRFMGQLETPSYKIGEGPSSGQLPNVPAQSLEQLQSQARPTSELVGGNAGRVAQAISPKTLAGETLVPLQGQGMQAFGERVGRGVRTNPGQALAEAGITALTGIPFKTISQGIGELGARYLGAKTGFMPGFSEKVGQAQARQALQPNTPLLTNQPTVAGPVNPNTIYVAPEGVAGTNIGQVSQAGAMAKYPPQPVAPTPQQMAIQKTQEIVNQNKPNPTPVVKTQQTITPVQQTTVRPSNVIRQELNNVSNMADELHQTGLENGIKYGTPEGEMHSAQLNQLNSRANALQKELELAQKAEKQASKKKAPSNISQMIVDDGSSTWNSMKLPENASPVERKIATMTQVERDRLESNLRQSLDPNDPMHKTYLDMFNKYRIK